MIVEPHGSGVRTRVKAVPGSKRDAIAGALGHRLEVKMSEPPEDRKANATICGLLAKMLGAKPRDISVIFGPRIPREAC